MKPFRYLILLGLVISCQPKVLMFTAEPAIVRTGDPVRLTWETRGTASMTVREKKIDWRPDSVQVLEFSLTATCCGKPSAPYIRQVVVNQLRAELALILSDTDGDSLVYTGTVDTTLKSFTDDRFKFFRVTSLSLLGGDSVTVRHRGRTCTLAVTGVPSACMNRLDYSGAWEVRIKMTAAEVADRHVRPGSYKLIAEITPK